MAGGDAYDMGKGVVAEATEGLLLPVVDLVKEMSLAANDGIGSFGT